MRRFLFSLYFRILGLALVCWSPFAFAGVEQITKTEFRKLAEELAPKVNLFQEVWKEDPQAVFYGGTSRDYLYWLKGKFRQTNSRTAADRIVAELRALPIIDVREFVIGESDIDVIANSTPNIDPEKFGVRKIDGLHPEIFDPASALGKNELDQGFIPVEKIRIARKGISSGRSFGDGVGEIYDGVLSVHFSKPDKFAKTYYAERGENHPILLALRYLRLQGINYFQTYGPDLPKGEALFEGFEQKSQRQVAEVIEKSLDGKELLPYLKQERFVTWINSTIKKSFTSYTNPTAVNELLKAFKVDKLAVTYSPAIGPTNQYVFRKHRDQVAISKAYAEFGINPDEVVLNASDAFPDGYLYHGTKSEVAFKGILYQGVIQSEDGSSGAGLYGVAEKDKKFSENWGGKKNLIRFPVTKKATIADFFGIDILKYPYAPEAYVVKNAGVLGVAEGVYRQIEPFPRLLKRAKDLTALEDVKQLIEDNFLNAREAGAIIDASSLKGEDVLRSIKNYRVNDSEKKKLWTMAVIASKKWGATEQVFDLFKNHNDFKYSLIEDAFPQYDKNVFSKRLREILDLDPRLHVKAIEQFGSDPVLSKTPVYRRLIKDGITTISDQLLGDMTMAHNELIPLFEVLASKEDNRAQLWAIMESAPESQFRGKWIIGKILEYLLPAREAIEHKKLVKKIVELCFENLSLEMLLEGTIAKKEWAKDKQLVKLFFEKIDAIKGKHDRDLARELVVSILFTKDHFKELSDTYLIQWLKNADSSMIEAVVEFILPKINIKENKELIYLMLKNKGIGSTRFIELFLARKEHSVNEEFLKAYIVKNGMSFEIAESILSLPHWTSNSEKLLSILEYGFTTSSLDKFYKKEILKKFVAIPAIRDNLQFFELALVHTSAPEDFLVSMFSQGDWRPSRIMMEKMATDEYLSRVALSSLLKRAPDTHGELMDAFLESIVKNRSNQNLPSRLFSDANFYSYALQSFSEWSKHAKFTDALLKYASPIGLSFIAEHSADWRNNSLLVNFILSQKTGKKSILRGILLEPNLLDSDVNLFVEILKESKFGSAEFTALSEKLKANKLFLQNRKLFDIMGYSLPVGTKALSLEFLEKLKNYGSTLNCMVEFKQIGEK